MRNLKLKYCQEYDDAIANAKFLLHNPNSAKSDVCYVATTDTLYLLQCGSGDAAKVLVEVPDLVGAEYLALDNEICLATAGGEVLLVNPESLATTEGTFCDVGIECMAWSSDQDVVVFVTRAQNVVVMTCTYDVLAEHSLLDKSEGEGQFVNVGWGKKETQFHGSEGKRAAQQKTDVSAPVNIDALPKAIKISWRADGAYFVVSYVCTVNGRTFKVFDKEGKLHYVAEKQSDLLPPVAWRPTGTWIAIPQRLPNKSTVALFEKNGLRHRELNLPFDLKDEPIISCKWSGDSDVLAVETRQFADSNGSTLYLYTISNYHWYLKQVLCFKKADPISVYDWDNRVGEEKTLHVLLSSGRYIIYKWKLEIDRHCRSGLVIVIDGKRLLLSDFAKAVIPPPMCNQELVFDFYINAVTLTSVYDELQLCVCDAGQCLHFYKAPISTSTVFSKINTFLKNSVEDDMLRSHLGTICWFDSFEGTFLVVTSTLGNISTISFIAIENSVNCWEVVFKLSIEGIVTALCSSGREEPCELYVHTTDGKIHIYDINKQAVTLKRLHAQLGQTVEHLETFNGTPYRHTIALSSNQCLYINDQRIANDVTSFCLAGNYLAFTKLTSLHFLRLSNLRLIDERRLERGAKIVIAMSESARIVLQMPRGNLETIWPRVLSLELVAVLLDRQQYYAAFDMLRKQRINLNIICDHNMCAFVQHLDVFLNEIQNPHWLNLFLSDLQNEDFTKTMYASNYEEDRQVYPDGFKVDEKVSYICNVLCTHMEGVKGKRFLLPILTAYVKLGELEKALALIWEEKKHESTETKDSVGAEEALRHLLYMVDVNQLYNVALGTYDFGLVLFVAQKSQKDPKEFLVFLNELRAYELNYRKFKIDEHLKRYEKAVQHIANCGMEKFDEALAFIEHHRCYTHALRAYWNNKQCYRKICIAFADYLRANGRFDNASIMYERGGNLKQAMLSAKHVLDWQRTLKLAKAAGQDIGSVALSLVGSLQEQGRHKEAYELCKTYGESFKEALQILVKGRLFLQAIFEVNMQENKIEEDLIVSLIRPELLVYKTQLCSAFESDEKMFTSYKQRLLDIRKKHSKRQTAEADDYGQADIDECDLLSDTTSLQSSRYTTSSYGTGKTFRSSKNRRKHERKLLNLKPGNPFEDIALIDALYNQIVKLVNQQQHIHDTCKALLVLQQDTVASELQNCFKRLLTLLKDSVDDIWIPEMLTGHLFAKDPKIDYTQLQNGQRYAMIDPQKRFKPQITIIDWEHEVLL